MNTPRSRKQRQRMRQTRLFFVACHPRPSRPGGTEAGYMQGIFVRIERFAGGTELASGWLAFCIRVASSVCLYGE